MGLDPRRRRPTTKLIGERARSMIWQGRPQSRSKPLDEKGLQARPDAAVRIIELHAGVRHPNLWPPGDRFRIRSAAAG